MQRRRLRSEAATRRPRKRSRPQAGEAGRGNGNSLPADDARSAGKAGTAWRCRMGAAEDRQRRTMTRLRVLVACEYSGAVRDAFIAEGHDAISCDLLPTDVPGPHYQGDVFDIINDGFDLMIGHPPCTFLCVSGLHWNNRGRGWVGTTEALKFFERLLFADIPRIAIENPIGVASTRIRPADQLIHPWQYGHPESKATHLWLKDLNPLKPTNILKLPESGRWENQTASGQNKLKPSADRWKIRSATYPGIAQAMAKQWGTAASAPAQADLLRHQLDLLASA